MFKKILTVIFFFSAILSFSQEMVKEFDLKLERKRDFYQVVNEVKKEVILFLHDKEKVTSVRFDDKFNIIDSLSAARPDKSYSEILGYSQNAENYIIFWGSSDRKKITSQFFNFVKKETRATPINLELKKEKIIKELTINNVFYLITIIKNTSILKFYVSDTDGNLNEKTIDLSHLEFKNIFNNPENLYTVLTDESADPSFQNISNDSPPSLAFSVKRYKIYTYNPDEIIFTMDNNSIATQILRVNLQNFSSDLKSIAQQKIAKGEYGALKFNSNSFLIDNKILQLKTNAYVLFLTISDLNGNKINEYKVLHDQEIDFKNSPLFQESNGFNNKKTIEKSESFLRKIHDSPSISCYSSNGLYFITIGSSQDKIHGHGGGMAGMGMGMAPGGMGGGMTFSPPQRNYTLENLISYKDKFVVYTNCLFDSSFNHLNGEIKTSAFDKARIFLEENKELKQSTLLPIKDLYKDLIIFKFNTALYLGNYNKDKKKYQIFSFKEESK